MAFTFRPTEEASAALERIKRDNEIPTSSKAIEYVLKGFSLLKEELVSTRKLLNESEAQLETIRTAIIRKEKSDRAYNEMISRLIPENLNSTRSGREH